MPKPPTGRGFSVRIIIKGVGGGPAKKKLNSFILTYFHIQIMGKQELFTEFKIFFLVPRYDSSKSGTISRFFAKCIGNPGILGI